MIWDEFLRHFRLCDEEDSGLSDEEQKRKGPKNRPKHTRERKHQDEKNFLEKFKTVSYLDGDYEMRFILPNEGVGIDEVVETLAVPGTLEKAVANGELCRIHYAVPRFELESDMDLNESLQALGMNLAFTWDSDFSALSAPYAPITSIRQVTTLKVDEDGSEGAAVTVVAGETANLGEEETIKEVDFTLDRPFLFQITESATGTVLFMGKVGKPE